jgi:hypothetical protein
MTIKSHKTETVLKLRFMYTDCTNSSTHPSSEETLRLRLVLISRTDSLQRIRLRNQRAPPAAAIPWKRSIPPVEARQRLVPRFSPIPLDIYPPAIG